MSCYASTNRRSRQATSTFPTCTHGRVIMRYVLGLLRGVPMLAQLIESETRESISLRNRVVIEVHTASFRSTRGYAIVAGLLDELAFWPTDEGSAEPDAEVISAIKSGMATIP